MARTGVVTAPPSTATVAHHDAAADPRRRRVGSMLNTFYRIENASEDPAAAALVQVEGTLDAQSFDARKHFDDMVASGHLKELVGQKKELDLEIQNLDSEMQGLVYKNYKELLKATDVIKQMNFCIDGMDPDLNSLQEAVDRLTTCEHRVEDGVAKRSNLIDGMLKQQRLCRKLQMVFSVPATLKSCLDRGEYGRAVETYCCSVDFLRQYKHIASFRKVLEEAEQKMTQIGSALEMRLRSPYLFVGEAVNSSLTLLDMGKDRHQVLSEYLRGRRAHLKSSLEHCFCKEPLGIFVCRQAGSDPSQQDLHSPESIALNSICWRLNDTYILPLTDAVEGFYKLQEGRDAVEDEQVMPPEFVRERLKEMLARLSESIQANPVSVRVLVSCMHSIRDTMRRLHELMPSLMNDLMTAFFFRIATTTLRSEFREVAVAIVDALIELHGKCKGLQESCAGAPGNVGLDEVLEEIARTEHSILMMIFARLTKCQPLHTMLGIDTANCQKLVRELGGLLAMLHLVLAEVSLRYVGSFDPPDPRRFDPSLRDLELSGVPRLEEVESLDWNSLYALALVRIGRHMETKGLPKSWAIAAQLFPEVAGQTPTNVAVILDVAAAPPPGLIYGARAASQAVITHYVTVAGQRLASFFRNSIQNKNWMTVREPRKPSVLIETVILKEVQAFDAQLARLLGDPKRAKPSERRPPGRSKDDMEMEIERMVAKKLQVFATVPFNRNGAIVGILRIAFKALFEHVREEVFAKYGLQQIQVDCAFLADAIRDFVESEDAKQLDALLDEALICTAARCDDPTLLELSVVQELASSRKGASRGPDLS